jgi:alkylation response protein AidB-like acyl-CoA dehydrogenase
VVLLGADVRRLPDARAGAGRPHLLPRPPLARGERNAIRLIRLKDKLGNRSNASAEIEYEGAIAHRLGPEGEGVRTVLEMVHHTRLDTAAAPAGLMRAALAGAHRWTTHRTAFQRRLIDQPLMRAVLADLALDWEGATALAFRVARAFDAPAERPFARVAVALAKYLNNKLCVRVTAEAMEALGGMGYVEDTALPLFYREAPLNGIWEGSGNVICLDILRTLAREPGAAPGSPPNSTPPGAPPEPTTRRSRSTAPAGRPSPTRPRRGGSRNAPHSSSRLRFSFAMRRPRCRMPSSRPA